MKNSCFFIILIFIVACNNNIESPIETDEEIEPKEAHLPFKYAKGFTIGDYGEYKVISVKNVWVGENQSFRYVLYKNDKPDGFEDAVFIKVPIQSIACMSLTHVSFIEKISQENSITSLSGCEYVSSSLINNRIKSNLIKEIGQVQGINYEMLLDNRPAVVMAYGIDASSNNHINKMKSLGLDVVLNAEYMETHPLGKAEWIKFIAEFYDERHQADSIFNYIEDRYLSLLALTENLNNKPTVFTGMPWNGAWYVPGGKSFQAQFFKDAGAQYLWVDNDEKSSLVKSKEIIIDEAIDADYWLNLNSYVTISSVIGFDKKFENFKAIKYQQLYNNDRRLNDNMGNDYWESGVVNPHLVLEDLIEIFHPTLLDHQLYYYRNLN